MVFDLHLNNSNLHTTFHSFKWFYLKTVTCHHRDQSRIHTLVLVCVRRRKVQVIDDGDDDTASVTMKMLPDWRCLQCHLRLDMKICFLHRKMSNRWQASDQIQVEAVNRITFLMQFNRFWCVMYIVYVQVKTIGIMLSYSVRERKRETEEKKITNFLFCCFASNDWIYPIESESEEKAIFVVFSFSSN